MQSPGKRDLTCTKLASEPVLLAVSGRKKKKQMQGNVCMAAMCICKAMFNE